MATGPCVFCDFAVRSQGEHVLPKWLLERWDGQGPFTIEVGKRVIRKKNGKAKREQLERVMLPVCGGNSPNDCNKWLDHTYERPARERVRAALDKLQPLAGPAVRCVAMWAVKTLLLYYRPEAVSSETHRHNGGTFDIPDAVMATWRDTGRLPEDISLWVGVIDPKAAPVERPCFDPVALPRTRRPDGAGGRSCSGMLGFSLPDGRQVMFHLMLHPLFDVENPFEAAGLVTRLWPDPPEFLDLATHPALDDASGQRMGGWVYAGGPVISLRPEERWTNPTGLKLLRAYELIRRQQPTPVVKSNSKQDRANQSHSERPPGPRAQ